MYARPSSIRGRTRSGASVLVTSGQIKPLLGTVQASSPSLRQVVAVDAVRSSTAPWRPHGRLTSSLW
jgi:hypothetical protein